MKILRAIPSLDPAFGGPSAHVAETTPLLVDRGHEVTILTTDRPGSPGPRNEMGARVIAAGPGRSPLSYAPGLGRKLRAEARDADVVLLHGLWQHTTAAGWAAARALGIPHVVVAHGMLDPWIVLRSPWRRSLRRLQGTVVDFRAASSASAVVFTSVVEAEAALVTLGRHRVRSRVIRYGTEDPLRVGVPIQPGRTLGSPVTFGMLGRFHEKKRVDLAIRAIAAVPDVRLRLAGPAGPELEALQGLARSTGVADRVAFEGPYYGIEKHRFLAGIDWLVLPSMQENFGRVVTEALAVGTPVIVSDQVNIWREVCEAGVGIVCTTDVVSVQTAIEEALLRTMSSYESIAASARSLFEAKFALERCVDDLEAVLLDATRA